MLYHPVETVLFICFVLDIQRLCFCFHCEYFLFVPSEIFELEDGPTESSQHRQWCVPSRARSDAVPSSQLGGRSTEGRSGR